jgi:hypothetical protein
MDDTDKRAVKSATPIDTDKAIRGSEPLWGKALEDMYAAIVEEPLPESLLDLLDKLAKQSSPEQKTDDRT